MFEILLKIGLLGIIFGEIILMGLAFYLIWRMIKDDLY